MKRLRVLILLIISFVTINASALKISHYEATFDMNQELVDNQIVLQFGYRGEEAYTTSFDIEYDSTLLEFVSANPSEGFIVEKKEQTLSSNTKKYSITFVSNYINSEIIYGSVTFKLTKNFNIGSTTEIKVSDIISKGENGKKYRSLGYYLELKRESKTTMSAIKNDFSAETDRKKFIDSILPFAIIGIVILFLLILIILLMPSGRKHEDRQRKIKSQIDSKNYPQPGVGPLPKFNQKKKKNIIEPEEETIKPLEKFEAKTVDMNSEKMNKPLETETNVFENNPTRQGQQGLININPLAFDDSDDDDDIDTL